jgi:hypothetical protein
MVARDITPRKQEENERLGLIKDLAAALSHVHLGTDNGTAVGNHRTPGSR